MNAAVFADEHPIGAHAPDSHPQAARVVFPRASVSTREIAVVQEMLTTLDTLTVAGQRHTMEKVVRFISDAIEGLSPTVGLRNRCTLADMLAQLAHESERVSPGVQLFRWSADSLLELLSDLV
jgi:hypothetical protein